MNRGSFTKISWGADKRFLHSGRAPVKIEDAKNQEHNYRNEQS